MSDRPTRFEWERALRRSDLHHTTRLVLLVLGTYMDGDGSGARPSQDTLARGAGISERSVRDHLARALAGGWIDRPRRGGSRGSGSGRSGQSSEYRTAIPEPLRTGTTVPVPTSPNRNEASGSDENGISEPAIHVSEPADCASEPEPGFRPPMDQEDHCSSSGEVPHEVKLRARAEIRAKRNRGEEIQNEQGLFRAICQQLLEAAELDQTLDHQPGTGQQREPTADDFRASAAALGRSRAGIALTAEEIRTEVQNDLTLRRFPELEDVALTAWQDAVDQLAANGAQQ